MQGPWIDIAATTAAAFWFLRQESRGSTSGCRRRMWEALGTAENIEDFLLSFREKHHVAAAWKRGRKRGFLNHRLHRGFSYTLEAKK